MFNNRFNNSTKDPLIEAVEGAMKDGNLRRQAEAVVNEAFGVFSRKAVVLEQLSAYDAALEEAYKCMKEGEKWEGSKEDKAEDKKLAKDHGMTLGQWEKSRADKKHDAKEKHVKEAKLADKDYDKDGKIESPKDEVWGSRLRAAKLAGKMEEKKMWEGSGVSGEDPGMEVAKQAGARQQQQTPSSTPARTGNAAGATISKAKDALNEISDALKSRYLKKNIKNQEKNIKAYHKASAKGDDDRADKYDRKIAKREYGYAMATSKKMEEETIEEAVSRKHFQQVADLIKGHESQEKRNELASHHAGIFAKQNPRFNHEKFHAAAGSTAHQTKTVKESVMAAIRAKYVKEEQGF